MLDTDAEVVGDVARGNTAVRVAAEDQQREELPGSRDGDEILRDRTRFPLLVLASALLGSPILITPLVTLAPVESLVGSPEDQQAAGDYFATDTEPPRQRLDLAIRPLLFRVVILDDCLAKQGVRGDEGCSGYAVTEDLNSSVIVEVALASLDGQMD